MPTLPGPRGSLQATEREPHRPSSDPVGKRQQVQPCDPSVEPSSQPPSLRVSVVHHLHVMQAQEGGSARAIIVGSPLPRSLTTQNVN